MNEFFDPVTPKANGHTRSPLERMNDYVYVDPIDPIAAFETVVSPQDNQLYGFKPTSCRLLRLQLFLFQTNRVSVFCLLINQVSKQAISPYKKY